MVRKRSEQDRFIESPELPQEASGEVLPHGQLYKLDSYKNILVSNCRLAGARAVTIDQAHFKIVQISNTQFSRFDLSNTRFDACDLANTGWDKASLNKIEFIGCKLIGFQIIKS